MKTSDLMLYYIIKKIKCFIMYVFLTYSQSYTKNVLNFENKWKQIYQYMLVNKKVVIKCLNAVFKTT